MLNRVLVRQTVVASAATFALFVGFASQAQTENTLVPIEKSATDSPPPATETQIIKDGIAVTIQEVEPMQSAEDVAHAKTLSQIPILLRDGKLDEASRLLKAMQPQLAPDQKMRWAQLASRTALRQGDRKWLNAVNQEIKLGGAGDELLIMSAMRFLQGAQMGDARRALQNVNNPEMLNIIPHRRYMQLWAKLEQLEGDAMKERVHARRLVDYVTRWPSATCQSCHANPKKYDKAVTTFDLKGWWVGQRYSTLLRQTGEAARVRREAEAALAQNANDNTARLRLAYALRAQGKITESDKLLRTFEWAAFPDRETKTPLRFGAFP